MALYFQYNPADFTFIFRCLFRLPFNSHSAKFFYIILEKQTLCFFRIIKEIKYRLSLYKCEIHG